MRVAPEQDSLELTRAELTAIEKRFHWILAPTRSLWRSPGPLLREPTTYMARVRAKVAAAFEKRVSQVGEEQFARELVGEGMPRRVLSESFARMGSHLRGEERAISRLPGGDGLLGLLGAADARVSNSPLLLSVNLKVMLGVNAIGPMGDLHRALQERGEQRARMLVQAAAHISEEVYKPYLVEVWNLTELAAWGRVPRRGPGGFGDLVKELVKRVGGVEGVVEPLALRVRNAVAHKHWEYLPSSKRVAFWNAGDSWGLEVSVDELKVMADRHLTVAATTFPRAVQWFVMGALLESGLWGVVGRALGALERNDRTELELVGREIAARTKGMYGELESLFTSTTDGWEHLTSVADENRRWLRGEGTRGFAVGH